MAMARRLGSGQEGVLTVGFSGSVMLTTLPKAIERYRRLYPRVELRLRELVTAEQMTSLLYPLKAPDLLAQRRLCHPQLRCRLAEMQGFGDGEKVT
jgi:DNA-binding transcriptional LysR family regulator